MEPHTCNAHSNSILQDGEEGHPVSWEQQHSKKEVSGGGWPQKGGGQTDCKASGGRKADRWLLGKQWLTLEKGAW